MLLVLIHVRRGGACTDGGNGASETTGNKTSEMRRDQNTRSVFHLVIPNKKRDCVLAEVLPNGVLRLPRIKLPLGFRYPEPDGEDKVEAQIEAQLGICGYLLGNLEDDMNKRIQVADVVENHEIFLVDILDEHSVIRKPREWIRQDVAYGSKWVRTNSEEKDGEINRQLEHMFESINSEHWISRDDGWETLGWFEKVLSWTRDKLEARNMVVDGRLRQWQRCPDSSVTTCKVKMREKRDELEEKPLEQGCAEIVFVKAVIPASREPQRTAAIGAVLGNIVPEVLAVHEKEGLMIQRNGGVVTDAAFDQEALIDTIFKMQELSMNRISELEAGGMEILDSEWLESNFKSIAKHKLFHDYESTDVGDESESSEGAVEALLSIEDDVKKGCRKITSLGLPRTVVHGDLCLRHVGSPSRGDIKLYQFFDWGNSFIGNPLHDFETVLRNYVSDFPELRIDCKAGLKRMRRRWIPHVSEEDVKLIFDILGLMSSIFQLHSLTQEYDACDKSSTEGRVRVFRMVDEWLSFAFIVPDIPD